MLDTMIVSLVATVFVSWFMWRFVPLLELNRTNFKGKVVPTGFGIVLVLGAVPGYILLLIHEWNLRTLLFFVAVLGFGILGFLDDMFGNRSVGGFHGHVGLFLKGRITTGLMKAFCGGIIALGIGLILGELRPIPGLVKTLVIALGANTLNLLDLRPGRAIGCFWLILVGLSIVKLAHFSVWPQLIPLLIPAVWLTWLDRSSRVMLGDAGSNALGAVLGMIFACELSLYSLIFVVAVMIFLNIYAEKWSISEAIERYAVLRRVDRLLGER